MEPDRRTVLLVTGGAFASVAGCLGGESDGNESDGNESDNQTANETNASAAFNVSSLRPQSTEVAPNGTLNISASVENTGETEGQTTVELGVGNQTVASRNLTLSAGASRTVNFESVAAGELPTGQVSHRVSAGDDSASGSLTVRRPERQSVRAVTRSLIEEIAAGQFEEVYQRYTTLAQQNSSPGQFEALWLGLTAAGGSYRGIESIEETVQGGFDATDVVLQFDRGTHVLRTSFAEGNAPRGTRVNDEYERPEYVAPESFESREASVETENCIMDATVAVPDESPYEEGGQVPGVVLVHGSDPGGNADKDLTTIGAKPFKDLGEGIATEGVATLRYDRRTNACPTTIDPEGYTLDAVSVDDALLAVQRLREAEGVDPDRVAVAGHSLGGMAMPRILERDGDLAGGVGLAAPARSFYEIFIDQFRYLANVGEFEWDRQQRTFERWRDRIDRIRQGDYMPGDIVLGYRGALWDSVESYDQVGTAEGLDEPLLFLQGGRDFRVTLEDDFTVWQSELTGERTTFQSDDGLNHLFQFGEGPAVPTEYALQNNVDSAAVTSVADWVGGL